MVTSQLDQTRRRFLHVKLSIYVICMKIRTPRPIFGLNRFPQASKSAGKLHHVALRLQAMKSVSCFHTVCLKRHKSFVLTLFDCLL